MTKHIFRILSLFFLASLCATMTVSVYTQEGPKQKAHGAGVTFLNTSQYGWPDILVETHINFTFTPPDMGAFSYRIFTGPRADSWGDIEVQELVFGTYAGSIPQIPQGSPTVFFRGMFVEGEEIADLEYPGAPGCSEGGLCVDYENLEGWYKVGAFVDGGPGHENDFGLTSYAIPPEGFPNFPFAGDGEAQSDFILNVLLAGFDNFFSYFSVTEGNVNVKLWE